MTEAVVRISDPEECEATKVGALAAVTRYEKKALSYALDDEFNIYQAAQLANKRLQYEDLYLFAAYPRLYAIGKFFLDEQFGNNWADRTGLGRHIPRLIDWLSGLGISKWLIGDGSSLEHKIVPVIRYLTPYSLMTRVGELEKIDSESTDSVMARLRQRRDACGIRLFIKHSDLMKEVLAKLAVLPGARLKETESRVEDQSVGKKTRFFAFKEIGSVVDGIRNAYLASNMASLLYRGIHVYLPHQEGNTQTQVLFQAAARMRVVSSAGLRHGGLVGLGLSQDDFNNLVERTVLEFRDVR